MRLPHDCDGGLADAEDVLVIGVVDVDANRKA
jgi:hypothetical protein